MERRCAHRALVKLTKRRGARHPCDRVLVSPTRKHMTRYRTVFVLQIIGSASDNRARSSTPQHIHRVLRVPARRSALTRGKMNQTPTRMRNKAEAIVMLAPVFLRMMCETR